MVTFSWDLETKKRLKATRNGVNYRTVNIFPNKVGTVTVKEANNWILKVMKQAMKKYPNKEYQVSFYDNSFPYPFSTGWYDNTNEFEEVNVSKYYDLQEIDVSVSMIKINSIEKRPKKD